MLETMSDAEEEEGESAYRPPSAYQQLEDPQKPGEPGWSLRRCQQRLNKGIDEGMPEFNQEMLRRFLKDGDEELQELRKRRMEMNAPPPMPGAPVGGPPPGALAQPQMQPDLGIPQGVAA